MMLVLPGDPLNPRRPDEHFAAELAAARQLGIATALINQDALVAGDLSAAVERVPTGASDVVYRGWMVRADQYANLAEALVERDVQLRTTPDQYRRAHELPGWAGALGAVTPATEWTVGPDLDAFARCCAALGPGPAVLRDYVKSLKHYWDEAVYIPDAGDVPAATAVARRFLQLREDDFTGGFVLRRFERFVSAEARTWWIAGRCALITAHPDTADAVPSDVDVTAITALVDELGLPFVTVDLALRDDGVWRVIELGDGQVSDRPESTPADELIAALALHG